MEKELVEYIAQNLVNDPAQVRVDSRKSGASTILELRVAPEDMGRVIGKQGHVANAIRSLLYVVSTRKNTPIILDID